MGLLPHEVEVGFDQAIAQMDATAAVVATMQILQRARRQGLLEAEMTGRAWNHQKAGTDSRLCGLALERSGANGWLEPLQREVSLEQSAAVRIGCHFPHQGERRIHHSTGTTSIQAKELSDSSSNTPSPPAPTSPTTTLSRRITSAR